MKNVNTKLQKILLMTAIAISSTSSLAASYVTLKEDKTNQASSSAPIIDVYIGRAKAEKERVLDVLI